MTSKNFGASHPTKPYHKRTLARQNEFEKVPLSGTAPSGTDRNGPEWWFGRKHGSPYSARGVHISECLCRS
jgi:hypothetical protein